MKIGYARVSTVDQNLDLQITALKEFGCDEIFTEKRSAVKTRPELESMLHFMRNGDTIVIWKLDRLGRSLKNLLDIIEDLKKKNIILISLSDNLDSRTPLGKLFMQMSGAFAEYERNLNVERTKAGLAAAVARGVLLGRRKGLSSVAIATATAAANLYATDMTIDEICTTLKLSTATFYRYLQYKGIKKKYNYGRRKNHK